jgi:hypothetical protein
MPNRGKQQMLSRNGSSGALLFVPSDCVAVMTETEQRKALEIMERNFGADTSPSADLDFSTCSNKYGEQGSGAAVPAELGGGKSTYAVPGVSTIHRAVQSLTLHEIVPCCVRTTLALDAQAHLGWCTPPRDLDSLSSIHEFFHDGDSSFRRLLTAVINWVVRSDRGSSDCEPLPNNLN